MSVKWRQSSIPFRSCVAKEKPVAIVKLYNPMVIIALMTRNCSSVPSIEGPCTSNPYRFERLVFDGTEPTTGRAASPEAAARHSQSARAHIGSNPWWNHNFPPIFPGGACRACRAYRAFISSSSSFPLFFSPFLLFFPFRGSTRKKNICVVPAEPDFCQNNVSRILRQFSLIQQKPGWAGATRCLNKIFLRFSGRFWQIQKYRVEPAQPDFCNSIFENFGAI